MCLSDAAKHSAAVPALRSLCYCFAAASIMVLLCCYLDDTAALLLSALYCQYTGCTVAYIATTCTALQQTLNHCCLGH